MNSIEDAVNLFENGYMCSQAVFAAFSEDYGLSREQALKIGAYGDNKAESNEVCERFLDEFKRENGSFICRDLLGCDISTPEGVKQARDNNLFKEICPEMVRSAAEIVDEILK